MRLLVVLGRIVTIIGNVVLCSRSGAALNSLIIVINQSVTLNNITRGTLESLGVVLVSIGVGALGGFILGVSTGGLVLFLVLKPNLESVWGLLFLGSLGAVVGAAVTVVVGPVLYFTLLRGHLTWRRLTTGFLVCTLASLPYAVVGAGLFVAFTMPIVALVVSLIIRFLLPIIPVPERRRPATD